MIYSCTPLTGLKTGVTLSIWIGRSGVQSLPYDSFSLLRLLRCVGVGSFCLFCVRSVGCVLGVLGVLVTKHSVCLVYVSLRGPFS